MSQTNPPCFLLDGKTILPINHEYQLLISNKNLHSINNNNPMINSTNEKEYCACFLPTIDKTQSNNKYSNSFQPTRTTCQHHFIDRLLNKNNETYLITRIIPSMNLTNNSTQEENNLLPSATTIIIKPFISYENSRKTTFLPKKSSLKRCKSSLTSSSSQSSLISVSKHISTHQSHHRIKKKHRLSTFKDLTRSIPNTKISHENQSSNFLHSRTLLTIYQNKKQINK